MLRRVTILVLIFFLFWGCSITQVVPEPESPGARLYLKKCTQCHGLPAPKRHTAEQWDYLLVMMESFMEKRGLDFPADEREMIRNYLHKNAR
jgi:hypothetical protein